MSNFKQKFFQFMQGRYGGDKLNYALLILYIIVLIVNMFINSIILVSLSVLLFIYIIFRMFSRQVYKRANENRIFVKYLDKFVGFFTYNFSRIKSLKTKVYCKCPNCHAKIRLPRKKGKHTVACPSCHKDFTIKVHF